MPEQVVQVEKVVTTEETPTGKQVTVETPPKTAGWRTTEFWQSILVTAGGVFCIIYGVVMDSEMAVNVGTVMALGSSVSYTAARTLAKR